MDSGFTNELKEFTAQRGIGLAGWLSAGSLGGKREKEKEKGKREEIWKCVRVAPEDQKGKAPPSYTTSDQTSKMPPLVTKISPKEPTTQGDPRGPLLADSFPTNYMDRISSPKDSPAVWHFLQIIRSRASIVLGTTHSFILSV